MRGTKNAHDKAEAGNVVDIKKARTAQSPVHIRKKLKGSTNTNAMCKTANTEGVPAKTMLEFYKPGRKTNTIMGKNQATETIVQTKD